jgi:hypothetical protein
MRARLCDAVTSLRHGGGMRRISAAGFRHTRFGAFEQTIGPESQILHARRRD